MKDKFYLQTAELLALRSSCIKEKIGAVIAKDDVLISTGLTNSPKMSKSCSEIGVCEKERLGILPNERYELCGAVHSECNAIIKASIEKTKDATLYIAYAPDVEATPEPCLMCKRMIINARIKEVVTKKGKIKVEDWEKILK